MKELTTEQKEYLIKTMKETSLPLTSDPKKLFHASHIRNFRPIMDNGLKPNEIYGEIYFCEKEKECLKFIKRPCIIFEIDPNKLDRGEMYLSNEAKKFQALQYYKPVPKEAIKGWRAYS